MAEDPEGEIGVRGGEVQTADEAADFLFGGGGGAPFLGAAWTRFQVAAGAEGIEQERGKAFELSGAGGEMFFGFRNGLRSARQLVEADGYGLAEIHGAMLFAGVDAQEPMAVAEVFIRKASLLRTEKKSNGTGRKAFADDGSGLFKALDGVLQLTLADGGGSDNERAVRDRFGDGLELFGAGEKRSRSDGGARLAIGQLIGVDHAKMEEAEVAHGAGGCPDVQGIAWCDKNDTQAVGFSMRRQGTRVYIGREAAK